MNAITAIVLVFAVSLTILTTGCVNDVSPPISGERIEEVTLKVDAPFSTSVLTINQDADRHGAQIHYTASSPRTGIANRTDSKIISLQEFNELRDLIVNNTFWTFNKRYFEENLMDATTFTITVMSTNLLSSGEVSKIGQFNSVSCYGSCPEKITQITDKIEELWGRDILQVGN